MHTHPSCRQAEKSRCAVNLREFDAQGGANSFHSKDFPRSMSEYADFED
jgi:hypothetical protein